MGASTTPRRHAAEKLLLGENSYGVHAQRALHLGVHAMERTAPACDRRGQTATVAQDTDSLYSGSFCLPLYYTCVPLLPAATARSRIFTVKRENRIKQVVEAVNELGPEVSINGLADELDLSKSYVRRLVKEAKQEGKISDQAVQSHTSRMDREDRIKQVAEAVKKLGPEVSVKELADELDLSKSYVSELAKDAMRKGLINGQKSVPVIGYIFNRGDARTDGGERSGELRVLTTRAALLQAVRDHAPHLLSEAREKSLKELRKFVKNRVADGTTVVSEAWRFNSS